MKVKVSFLFIITLLQLWINPITSQAEGVSIGVIVPEESEYLNHSQLNRLQTKLEQIVSAGGISAMSNAYFVLYPVFEINESSLVEGGMKNIAMVNASLTLFIRQLDNSMIVNSISLDVKGTGFNKGEALVNALTSIKPYSNEFKQFIKEGKDRITEYYKTNLPAIRTKAKTLASQQRYDEALALLMSFPEELQGYSSVANDASQIYMQYMNHSCSSLLNEAKARMSLNDYDGAISILMQIVPACQCAKESEKLMKSIQQEIDNAIAYERKMKLYQMRQNADLKKQRIQAITEIAKAYFNRKPPVSYYQLIL